MSEQAEFLNEILANPDDLSARLVFADWLEERGDPRGEFIRVQCRLSELTEEDPEFRKLHAREQELIHLYKDEWVADISPLVFSCRLTRGFVEEIAAGSKKFFEHSKRLFKLAPIRHVNAMRLNANWLDRWREAPQWLQVHSFESQGGSLNSAELRTLLASPQFSRLERLSFGSDVALLFDSPEVAFLTSLRELSLTTSHLKTPRDFRQWWVRRLPRLRTLCLSWCNLGAVDLDGIVSQPLPKLTSLDLSNNPIGDAGAEALAGCASLDRLQTLNLSDADLGLNGLQALMNSPYLKGLRRLDVSRSRLAPAAIESLVESIRPTTLRLNDCQLTDASASILANAPGLAGLRVLELEGRPGRKGLTNSAALSLLKSPYLTQLTTLNLRHAVIDAEVQRKLRSRFGVGVCTFSRPSAVRG